MHRIGFRRLLPIVFTLLHVVLIWFAQTTPHEQSQIHRDSKPQSLAYQPGTDIPVELFEPRPLKPAQKIALVVELPAMFLAGLISAVLLPRNDWAWMYLSIPLVTLLWYSIGRWLDGLLGYIVRLQLPQTLRGLLSIAAVGVLCVSMAGLTPLYHHRTPDTYWVITGLALWSGLCLAIVSKQPLGD